MVTEISKTQIDRLGDRLRKGNTTDDDLRLLDEYRRSFTDVYDTVVERIRQDLMVEPTGRPAKSTTSISEKLRRESIRLTQIQDIAGCRLIVPELADQERLITSLVEIFPESTVVDRRKKPSNGYRAVHLIVSINEKAVEIQVRTALQQVWAELSEKLSDLVDPAIKYGGGHEKAIQLLSIASLRIVEIEAMESTVLEIQSSLESMLSDPRLTEDLQADIMNTRLEITSHKEELDTHREDLLNKLGITVKEFEEEFS
jgi:ppGpp synthetase/RelA/SpoT-type nucleotidyltranferase